MSSYFLLDSHFRFYDEETPSSYTITVDQTNDWPEHPRTVNAVPPSLYFQPLDFNNVVDIQNVLIFYDGTPIEPFIKLTFYNIEYKDHFFVNTLDDNREVKFFLVLDSVVGLGGGWFKYLCDTKQLMRLKRKGSFVVKLWTKDNDLLDVGADGRTVISIKVTPYHLEGSYDNNRIQARV